MIIERIKNIKDLENFIKTNEEEHIILTAGTIDISTVIHVIKTCEKVNKFLQIGIGKTFFTIKECDSKGCFGCPYYITEKSINEIINENL